MVSKVELKRLEGMDFCGIPHSSETCQVGILSSWNSGTFGRKGASSVKSWNLSLAMGHVGKPTVASLSKPGMGTHPKVDDLGMVTVALP